MSSKARLNDIPYGCYCYKIKKVDMENGRIETLLCPHYQFLADGMVGCSFLGADNMYEYDFMLNDQVKVCGENEMDCEINSVDEEL